MSKNMKILSVFNGNISPNRGDYQSGQGEACKRRTGNKELG